MNFKHIVLKKPTLNTTYLRSHKIKINIRFYTGFTTLWIKLLSVFNKIS